MQIFLTIKNTGIISIPVNYNYLVQSAIFRMIAEEDSEYADFLHNNAYGDKTKYKFFTFGKLKGKKHFHDKKLYFEGNMQLEIRSISDEFIRIFTEISKKTEYIFLGDYQLPIEKIHITDHQIDKEIITVRTQSPVVAKIQNEDKKSVYFSPDDVRFIKRLRETFENKYEVYYNKKPESTVDILPVDEYKKVVTMYKNTWVTAYHGKFQLCAALEYLQFLYDVGLGVKTSLGFGMFEIIE